MKFLKKTNECVYENPYPDKQITGIVYRPRAGKENLAVEMISFILPLSENALSTGKSHEIGEEFAWDGGTV